MSFDVIDTSVMPGDDIDPDAIDTAAGKIRSSGKKVSSSTTAAHAAWLKISGVYEAPEQGHLYHAMNPVKTQGEHFATDLGSGATALETFAETVRTIKAAVVKIRSAVKTFEDKIGSDGTIQPSGGYNPYGGGGLKQPKQWNEDTGMVDEQHKLAGEINTQIDALEAAQIVCANALADITGAPHVPTSGPGAPPAPPHVAEAQWYLTAPVDRKEDCGQQIAHAVVIDFIGGSIMGGLGYLGVSWSPTTGKFGNWWDTFKGSWSGLNKVVTAFDPVMYGLDKLPDPDPGAAERAQTRHDFLFGQVNKDPYAADPDHRYKEQPYRAWTNTVLNLATWLAPPLKALTLAKLGKAGELASDAAKAGNLAKAGEATRFASAADLVKALRESGSLKNLGHVSEALRTKVATLFGTSSETTHALENLHTPKLSQYDLTTHHGAEHPVTPPVRGDHGADHGPGSGSTPGSDDVRAQHPPNETGSTGTEDGAGHQGESSAQPRDLTQPHVSGKPYWGDPLGASHQDIVTRDKAYTNYHRLAPKADKLAHDMGVPKDALKSENLGKTVDRLVSDADSPADLKRARALEAAVQAKHKAYVELRDAGERMGVTASEDLAAKRGETLVGGPSVGPGKPATLDTVGWNEKKAQLTFYEGKGGDSPKLGTRDVDGVTTKQGSAAYLQDLLTRDPDVREFFTAKPEVLRGLRDGKVDFDYFEVSARTDGRVRVTHFDIKRSEIDFRVVERALLVPAR